MGIGGIFEAVAFFLAFAGMLDAGYLILEIES